MPTVTRGARSLFGRAEAFRSGVRLAVALVALAFGWAWSASGQEIPLDEPAADFMADFREGFWKRESAARALEVGLYEVAGSMAMAALEETEAFSDEERAKLWLIAIDSELGRDRVEEARALIDRASGLVDGGSLALRRALAALAEKDAAGVSAGLALVDAAALKRLEAPWYWLASGWLAYQEERRADGAAAFRQALAASDRVDASLRSQVAFRVFRIRLENNVETASAGLDSKTLGLEVGYRYGQLQALRQFEAGDLEAAVLYIEAQLSSLPQEYTRIRDEFWLLQTRFAGLGRREGRQAASSLLRASGDLGLKRMALQAVVEAGMGGVPGSEAFLAETLNKMIGEAAHPLRDAALYYRAATTFLKGDFEGAELDGELLESGFPNSEYRKGLLAIRASSAWSRKRYRTAASHLAQARNVAASGEERLALTILIGDCYFKAGEQSRAPDDFLNAAEAYATALGELPAGRRASAVLRQLALAYLDGGDLAKARSALDDPASRAKADPASIWRAEWALLEAMRRAGAFAEAYDRTQTALGEAGLDRELALRFIWVAMKLSVEAGQLDETDVWWERMAAFLADGEGEPIPASLRLKVEASSLLTLAESYFAIDEQERALSALEALRRDFGSNEAVLLSYLSQARYYSSINRTVEAQQLLTYLADNYKESRLAPMALYEAALNAEKRGQESFIEQANGLLERIASDYPDSDMVYYARLKQADLYRKLNQFGTAQWIYETLENDYRSRHDVYLAQSSLADTLLARAAEDPSRFDAAISRLERLMDLPDVPLDLRVEAGYKLGFAWRGRGELLKAKQSFWVLHDLFLVEEDRVRFLGPKGRFWLARTLFAMAEIAQQERELDKASSLYQIIVARRLPSAGIAKVRIEQLGRPEAAPK